MSWNEPGGGKKDPWSGRDQKPETPPEIDKVIRSLQEKFGKLLGEGRPGLGGSGRGLGLLAGGCLALWAATGFYIVDEGNRGVVTRFGAYGETTAPGLHWRWPAPIESHVIVNVDNQRLIEVGYRSSGSRQQSAAAVPKEALMLTQDENIVDVQLGVQYQIRRTEVKNYVFNVLDPDATVKQVTESAVRGVVGKSIMDFVLTEGRSDIAREVKNEIQQILDEYKTGISVTSVNLRDAQPPDEVQGAFDDAVRSREDEQRLKNEAEAYANEVIPKARGGAARQLQEAEGYKQRVVARAQGDASRFSQLLAEYEKAPEVTRQRLYVETIESVLTGSRTVLVDAKGSNNLYYLPLDKLAGTAPLQAGLEAGAEEAGAPPSAGLVQPAPVPAADSHPARVSSRGREPRGR